MHVRLHITATLPYTTAWHLRAEAQVLMPSWPQLPRHAPRLSQMPCCANSLVAYQEGEVLVHCLLLASVQLALPLVYHHPLSFLPELHDLCMHHDSLKAVAGHQTEFPLHHWATFSVRQNTPLVTVSSTCCALDFAVRMAFVV